ncbi:MAG: AAA family ATPase [Chlamydiae bacterium]|nr:AAA family ATPase [Chlamydiota bacterium]
MKKKLPIGISDFKKLIDGEYFYVDKSLFIEEILEKGTEVALIPRMRRFGKTLNLSMLRYFFEKTDDDTSYLFKGLQIWKKKEYRSLQGEFPVIYITFKDIKHSTWEHTFEHFQRLISEEFQRHRYLLEGDLLSPEEQEDYLAILGKKGSQVLYQNSLKLLVKWLFFYHKKQVVLLIDEYDAPADAAYMGKYYDPLIEFLRNLLSNCLKDSSYLKKGVLTGILRIAKESIFSGLNNVTPFSIFNETFRDKFGLLESEVEELLKYYGFSEKLPVFRQWYNGYRIGSSGGIYNPWSVLRCIAENGFLAPYWVNTSDNALMKQLITKSGSNVKTDIEDLLKGGFVEKKMEEGIVFPELDKNPTTIWSLLVYCGYLTIDAIPDYGIPFRLRIPNFEIRELYQAMVSEWFDKSIDEYQYRKLLESLINGEIDTFSSIFKEFVLSYFSVFDVPFDESEKVYHAFVLGMLVGLKGKYDVKSNRESGFGRYDVMIIPENPHDLGIIMEFKKDNTSGKANLELVAKSAILQIEEKKYAAELLDRGVRRILYLGFAFSGKNVFIEHKFTG